LENEVCSVELPPKFKSVACDNGVRGDTTVEKLSKLRPAFDKQLGTITAGNASWLTDGAAAVLLMTEEKALAAGLRPKARIVDYAITGADLRNELLLGPAYAVAKVLRQTGVSIDEIGVLEFHEAFAGQVLANLAALADGEFSRKQLGLPGPVKIAPPPTACTPKTPAMPWWRPVLPARTATRCCWNAAERLQSRASLGK
jgi:acetyl-CoA acyltransferase